MKLVNISNGPRGAYLRGPKGDDGKDTVGDLVMAESGETIEGDFIDVNDEWFAKDGTKAAKAADPLDHDGDGKKGGVAPAKD